MIAKEVTFFECDQTFDFWSAGWFLVEKWPFLPKNPRFGNFSKTPHQIFTKLLVWTLFGIYFEKSKWISWEKSCSSQKGVILAWFWSFSAKINIRPFIIGNKSLLIGWILSIFSTKLHKMMAKEVTFLNMTNFLILPYGGRGVFGDGGGPPK